MSKPLTLAQQVEAAITLAKIEALEIRRHNQALALNRVRRAIEVALVSRQARLVSFNQSRGRGAHYRFPDRSAMGVEVARA